MDLSFFDIVTNELHRISRTIRHFWTDYSDNPIFWLAVFLAGVFLFKLVWDALQKEK